ncbi:phage holin family protein [bacterium]|nr:phage holin family protein [bacterium]
MAELISALGTPQIQWIVTLIGIDVVLGLVAAIMKKDFRLGKVANFMVKPVLGYVFGFAVLTMVAQAIPSIAIVTQGAYALIWLALIGSILNNIAKMGLSLPSYLLRE